MANSTLQEFLHFTASQQEVSLILAKDVHEQTHFVTILHEHGFQEKHDLLGLLQSVGVPSKNFYIVRDEIPKALYEFLYQYPTRHIGIYDDSKKKILVANPVYKKVAVIYVITKENLEKIHASGFYLLDKVGLVYQS